MIGGIKRFEAIFRMTISLLIQLSKIASNVSCLTVQHRCISSTDLGWMVQDNHLSCEANFLHQWVIFAVTSHIATKNMFDRHVLESHIVHRRAINQSIMVHFKRLVSLTGAR